MKYTNNHGIPVQKGKHVRVWFAVNGLRPDTCPTLEGCIIPTGSVSFTQNVTTEAKKCPSIYRRGEFDTVYEVVQREDPTITTSLSNRLNVDSRSLLLKLTKSGCKVDIIYAYGVCEDPNMYNDFTKLEIFQDVTFSNYDHDAVGAFDETTLTDDVLENVEINATQYYLFARPEIREAVDWGAAEIRALLLADRPNCGESGDCHDSTRSDGCQRLFAVEVETTEVTLQYTINGGKTWTSGGIIPGISSTGEISLAASADMLFVFNENDASYSYTLIDDVVDGSPAWVTVAIDEGVSEAWSDGTVVYMGGVSGQIYSLPVTQAGLAPTLVDGTFNASKPISVSGTNKNFVVFGHQSGDLTVVEYGVALPTNAPTANNVTATEVIAHDRFLITLDVGSTGVMYYTNNGGKTFTEIFTFVNTVTGLSMANYAIGYAVAGGHLWMTADGGCTWTRLSDNTTVIAGTSGPSDIETCDDGNYVIYHGNSVINLAEDKLRSIYGAI